MSAAISSQGFGTPAASGAQVNQSIMAQDPNGLGSLQPGNQPDLRAMFNTERNSDNLHESQGNCAAQNQVMQMMVSMMQMMFSMITNLMEKLGMQAPELSAQVRPGGAGAGAIGAAPSGTPGAAIAPECKTPEVKAAPDGEKIDEPAKEDEEKGIGERVSGWIDDGATWVKEKVTPITDWLANSWLGKLLS